MGRGPNNNLNAALWRQVISVHPRPQFEGHLDDSFRRVCLVCHRVLFTYPTEAPPSHAVALTQALPPTQMFSTSYVAPATRPNSEIAQDFLDLSFRMESGRAVANMTRFDGPITVRATGDVNATMMHDLQALLARIRREAKLDVTLVNANQPASITIQAVPRATMQAAVPRAACFVVPRLTSWSEFKIARRTQQVDWTTLTRRDRAIIFMPADVAPQETRNCLHEELAQALGPLNDLYRLPAYVFNDDNIHGVLTSFVMRILRAYNDQDLRNGMSRGEVAARIHPILAQLNPSGERSDGVPLNDTSRDWITNIETALANGANPTQRRNAAAQAIRLGNAFGWTGPRDGFA